MKSKHGAHLKTSGIVLDVDRRAASREIRGECRRHGFDRLKEIMMMLGAGAPARLKLASPVWRGVDYI